MGNKIFRKNSLRLKELKTSCLRLVIVLLILLGSLLFTVFLWREMTVAFQSIIGSFLIFLFIYFLYLSYILIVLYHQCLEGYPRYQTLIKLKSLNERIKSFCLIIFFFPLISLAFYYFFQKRYGQLFFRNARVWLPFFYLFFHC